MKHVGVILLIGLVFGGKESLAQEFVKNDVDFPKMIYFDTASTIPVTAALLDEVAAWSRQSDLSLLVEGHADERGEGEANLELGDRRARQVKADLMARGMDPRRLIVISHGEANPNSPGHTETSWQKNRRVLVYPLIDTARARGVDIQE